MGEVEAVTATEDHAYGFALRMFRRGEACEGIFMRFDGSPEPHWSVLESVDCTGEQLRFEVASEWWLGFTDVGPFAVDARLEGRLTEGRLTGTLTVEGESSPVDLPFEPVDLALIWDRWSTLDQASRCVGDRIRTR